MAAEDNLEMAKRGYAAFIAGDAETAMADMADDIEWVTPGNSAISGTRRGKQEIGAMWAQMAEKGFATTVQHMLADGDLVVVLTQATIAGESYDSADALTFRDGKLVRFQTTGDTALMQRVFGTA
jgi:uncharacterized protein